MDFSEDDMKIDFARKPKAEHKDFDDGDIDVVDLDDFDGPNRRPKNKSTKNRSATLPNGETTGSAVQEYSEKLNGWMNARQFKARNVPYGFHNVPLNVSWGSVRMYIKRKKTRNFARKTAVEYTLHLGDFSKTGGAPVLYAQQKSMLGGAHFIISSNSEDLTQSRHFRSAGYCGKLRGNTHCTMYTLYDRGAGVDEYEISSKYTGEFWREASGVELYDLSLPVEIRNCMSSIIYKSANDLGKSPMEVAIPQISEKHGLPIDWPDVIIPEKHHEPLINILKRVRALESQNDSMSDKMTCFQIVDAEMELHPDVEKIKHPSTKKSVKNFQLVKTVSKCSERRRVKRKEAILQMSKVSECEYNIDVRHPLTIFQAFAICLSRFDANL